jgi:nitroreductase
VFSCLRWANAIEGWQGPSESERPPAYIVLLGDTSISEKFVADTGIAAQTIMLAAKAHNLSGCMLAPVLREELRTHLGLSFNLQVALVVAIGESSEEIVLETVNSDEKRPYWRDENDVHHVPKRRLEDVIVAEFID